MPDFDTPPGHAMARHARRARLHDALTDAVRHGSVLMAAPAGSGKTALLRAWSAEQPRVHFCDLAGPTPTIPADQPGLVVVDNVQHAAPPHLDAIARLLTDPAGPRLVVAGRWIPPPLRTAAAATGTTDLGYPALALTEAETAQVCALYDTLPREVVAEMFAVTGGWATGVVIAASGMTGDPTDAGQHLRDLLVTGSTLHDFVVGDVLAHLSDDDRRAVYDTSTVETVCAALFTALTGRPDAARLLHELARDAMFAVRVGDRGWHRYRRLWRIALYTHLQHHEPGRLRALHRAASEWYATHGRYREAVHHATAAHDHDRAADLAGRHEPDIIAAGTQVALTPGPPRASVAVPGGWDRRVAPRPSPATASLPDPAHVVTAILALDDDRPLEARAALTGWLRAAQDAGPAAYARALRHSAAAELGLDNLDTATREATQARRILEDHGITGALDDGWARIVLAGVHLQRDELDAATDQLSSIAVELWHLDEPLNAADTMLRAMIEQQRGHTRTALDLTHGLIHTDAPPPGLHLLHAQLLLANGYRADAERHAETHSAHLANAPRRLLDAELLLARGNADRATMALLPFVQDADEPAPHRIDALLLLAAATAQLGDRQHAANLRRLARRLATPAGIRRPFLLDELRRRGNPDPAPTRRSPAPASRPASAPAVHLTGTERAVLGQLDTLLTIAEIAGRLHLTTNTVKTHVRSIYRKLSAHRRRDAVRNAHDRGLL